MKNTFLAWLSMEIRAYGGWGGEYHQNRFKDPGWQLQPFLAV